MGQDRDPEHSSYQSAIGESHGQAASVSFASRSPASPVVTPTLGSVLNIPIGSPESEATLGTSPPPSTSIAQPLTRTSGDSGQGRSLPDPQSHDSPPRSIRRNAGPQTSLSFEDADTERRRVQPLPPLPHDLRVRNSRIGVERPLSPGPRSGIDYIVPIDEKTTRQKTVGERLQPTLMTAIVERNKYAFKARITGYALNLAIGLQVLLGALTTGLSTVTTGHQTSIMTAILGGCATLTASYLARARGSNEPELSITRVKDLEQFIRECEAFQMDHGHNLGDGYDKDLGEFRNRFEELLGNGNGERRLSPPV